MVGKEESIEKDDALHWPSSFSVMNHARGMDLVHRCLLEPIRCESTQHRLRLLRNDSEQHTRRPVGPSSTLLPGM
jgi:hypothetical protein